MQQIVLPNGAAALLAGAQTPSLKRAALGPWPELTASECAAALGAKLERLLALDDVLHWRELGAEIVLVANTGLLFDEANAFGAGEADTLAEVAGVAAATNGALLGSFISASDNADCRFIDAAALKRGWLDLGGWALIRTPSDLDV